jgi:hypothetical protein
LFRSTKLSVSLCVFRRRFDANYSQINVDAFPNSGKAGLKTGMYYLEQSCSGCHQKIHIKQRQKKREQLK